MPESPVPPSVAAFFPADLPSPLKALAGIAVTMVHDVKHLPERALQLPGSVLTHLAAKSLKVQQQYADWVAVGEQFLGSLQEPSEEIPPWATFDEDLPAPEAPAREAAAPMRGLGPGSAFDLQPDELPPVTLAADADRTASGRTASSSTASDGTASEGTAPMEPQAATKAPPRKSAEKAAPARKAAAAKKAAPAKTAEPTSKAARTKIAAPVTKAAKAPGRKKTPTNDAPGSNVATIGARQVPASATGAPDAAPSATPIAAPEPDPSATAAATKTAAAQPRGSSTASTRPQDTNEAAAPPQDPSGASAPQSLPDFDHLTIPQLRTRLKTLRTAELTELIAYEQSARNRAPVVGMLRARLETLQN